MKKKNTLLLLILILSAATAQAQTATEALRYSQQFYDGTARSLSMGNALVSLGGDQGALSYNPAASGVYRYSEVTFTPSIYTNLSHATYLEDRNSESRTRFALSNLGWTSGFITGNSRGLLGMNFSIIANQTNNFAFRTGAEGTEAISSYLASLAANMPSGLHAGELTMPDDYPSYPFDNTNASWSSILAWNTGLMDTLYNAFDYIGATENATPNGYAVGGRLRQKYLNERTGYIQDVIFNASGNVSDIFFFGLNVTLQSIWFSEYSSFSETAMNPADFETGFTTFTDSYRQTTSGLGVHVKAGFIVRPVAGLSIGGSISTPNWMFLTDNWQEEMNGHTKQFGAASVSSPTGIFDYRINAPFKWNLGIGYTFRSAFAVGIDYEMVNYSSIKMMDSHGDRSTFDAENSCIASDFRTANNLRAGLEYRIIPQLSLRLGYNYYQSTYKDVNIDNSRHYASIGAGFSSDSGFFVDLAYQQQCNFNRDSYTLYDDYGDSADPIKAPVLGEKYLNWKMLLSLGFRF